MKIVLVRCPQVMAKFVSASFAMPPLGLAYVAAALRQAGHDVSIVDSAGEDLDRWTATDDTGLVLRRGLTDDEILERLEGAEMIGFGLMFSQGWLEARELIHQVRERFPDATLMAGGEHFSGLPDLSMRDAPLDFILEGEGEETACELAAHLEGHGALEDVSGIWFRSADGDIERTATRTRIKDVDALAWPAWDLVPVENYLSGGHMTGVDRGRSMPMNATRGCPYQCTFCTSPSMWTTRYVMRSPADVVAEIQHYVTTYRATNFDFQDLTAIVQKRWAIEFAERLLETGLEITWQVPSGTRSEALDDEVLPLLVKSGCTNLTYAPESGDIETLRLIKKKIKPERMLESMRSAVVAGCNVKANFIFGFTHDSWSSIWPTFRMLTRMAVIGVHDVSVAPLRPYPGSELFKKLQETGEVPEDLDDDYFMGLAVGAENLPGVMEPPVSYTPHLDAKTLSRLRNLAMMWFFFVSWIVRPQRAFSTLRAVVTGHQESRLDKSLVELIRRVRAAKAATAQPVVSA